MASVALGRLRSKRICGKTERLLSPPNKVINFYKNTNIYGYHIASKLLLHVIWMLYYYSYTATDEERSDLLQTY